MLWIRRGLSRPRTLKHRGKRLQLWVSGDEHRHMFAGYFKALTVLVRRAGPSRPGASRGVSGDGLIGTSDPVSAESRGLQRFDPTKLTGARASRSTGHAEFAPSATRARIERVHAEPAVVMVTTRARRG